MTNWGGTGVVRSQEQDIGSTGFDNLNGDFNNFTSGGDGAPNANGLATWPTRAAINDKMFGWSANSANGTVFEYKDDLATTARGIRLGFRPMFIDLEVEQPSYTQLQRAGWISAKLDAAVHLIPIEVAVMYSSGIPLAPPGMGGGPSMYGSRLPAQLQFWDQVQSASTTRNSSPTPGGIELVDVKRAFDGPVSFGLSTWMNPVSRNGGVVYQGTFGQLTPDSVWAGCGVQFRLVNYLEVPTDDKHVNPIRTGAGANWPPGTLDATPCTDNAATVLALPGHVAGALVVIFMYHPEFPLTGNSARTVVSSGQWVSCVAMSPHTSTGNYADVAHELGHQLAKATVHPSTCRTMCAQGDDGPALKSECNYISDIGDSYNAWPH